jgi:hypothetical protein
MSQPAQPTGPQRAAEPNKNRHRLIGAGIVLAILLLVSCSAIVSTLGGDDNAAAPASAVPVPSSTTAEETTEPEPGPSPESNCKPLKKSQLSEIAPGMDDSVRVKSAVWVPLTDEYQFGFNQVIALRLSTGDVATFATENLGKSDQGMLMAVNGPARKHFTWGAAVNPGSPMDDDLQAVKDSYEYAEALDCARGQG